MLNLEAMMPFAVQWVSALEAHILEHGEPLGDDAMECGRRIGIRYIERVRVLCADALPVAVPEPISGPMEAMGLGMVVPMGAAFGYGIFLNVQVRGNLWLLAHELTHTRQYEALGGKEPFLMAYVRECLQHGYPNGPLEREAMEMQRRFFPTGH